MTQFRRGEDSINNERGSEAGSEAQKKHLPAFVASHSLQGRIIDKSDGTTKSGLKVKIHPSWSQIVRLRCGFSAKNRAGITHGYHVILPTTSDFTDA